MDFFEFLKHQIQPCVYCYPTPELIKKVPNYESIIFNAWENAQSSLPFKIRCVFPPLNEKLAVIQSDLVSVRENHFNSIFNNQNELESIELIREYFFRQEFANTHFFPDIPIGFLIIAHDKGPTNMSELNSSFPTWVSRFTSKAVKAKLILPTKNVTDPIIKYLKNQCIPNYTQLCIEIERSYQQKWKGIQQRVAAFFKDQEELYDSLLYLKLYADLCLQSNRFDDAISAYQDIVGNFNYIDFTNQAQFCIVLCDIISNNISQKTLKNILLIKKSKLPYNQYYIVLLTELYLRILLDDCPRESFSRLQLPRTQREKESNMLFRPFLFEQIAALSQKNYFPLYLSNSAQQYNGIGALKLAALCYRASVECFNGVEWPSITQTLTEKTLKSIIKTDLNSLDMLVNLLNSKSLPFSKKVADIIKSTLTNPNFLKLNHIQDPSERIKTNQNQNQNQKGSPSKNSNQGEILNQNQNIDKSNTKNAPLSPSTVSNNADNSSSPNYNNIRIDDFQSSTENSISSQSLYPPGIIYELPFPCGFVKAKITDFYVTGFPCVQIKEIADEWKQTLERMFGAYRRMTFFDYDSLSQNLCCVGEEASIEVYLKFHGEIEISHIYLLVSGSSSVQMTQRATIFQYNEKTLPTSSSFSFAKQKTSHENNINHNNNNNSMSPSFSSTFLSSSAVSPSSSKKIKKAQIRITPKVSGELEIYGIGFIWKDVCRLESPFKHLPWKMKVLEPSARVDFTFSEVCQKVVVGQYVSIEVIAKNSSIDLDSFSLLIKGDVEATLIYPEVEEVFGQSKMDPLKSNEERKILIGARFRKEGKFKLILIFPYWSKKSPPPRYGLKIYDFKVYRPSELKIERSFSGIQILSPKDSWALGFSGSIPTIEQHLVVVDGRFCLLDFVSMDTNDDEENFLDLPDYCKKFLIKDNAEIEEKKQKKKNHLINNNINYLHFWYQNHYGIIQTQIQCPSTPVSIVMKKDKKDKKLFFFYVSNISNEKMVNLVLSFGESDLNDNSNEFDYQMVVSGLAKKVIKSLDVHQTVVFKSRLILFEAHSTLPITLITENSKYTFYIYVEGE